VRSKTFVVRTAALGFLLVVAVAVAVVARGGDSGSPSAAAAAAVAKPRFTPTSRALVGSRPAPTTYGFGKIVRCNPVGPSRARPASLPEVFPLPRGTVITAVTVSRIAGAPPVRYIWGHVPLPFPAAASFFARELPRQGFALIRAETEPGEADARFAGHGRRGGWQVLAMRGCPQKVLLLLGLALPR
jgi:hypothetical protein